MATREWSVTDRPHRPALFAGHEFSAFEGAADPAVVAQIAHESARELLARVRRADVTTREKAVTFADDNGIDVLAELWSKASSHSLPGAMWRVYLIRDLIRQQGEHMAHVFEAGVRASSTGDPVIAGAPVPTSAAEVRDLADLILHGVFSGDLSDALDRAAAFCRLAALGGAAQAAEVDAHNSEQAARLTTQAARLSSMGAELAVCARMWRAGTLD